MNTIRTILFAPVLAAVCALPSRADEKSAPAPAPAPEAASAAPSAEVAPSAAPAPGRVLLPKGRKWEAMPPEEREHYRRMAEFKAARDSAERDLLRLDGEAQARKEAILEENEEARKLFDRIQELQAEFTEATNALGRIYREDEALGKIAEQIEPARKIVEANQFALNKEVVDAMHKRMAAQRAAYAKEHPEPEVPAPTPESVGMDPVAFTNLYLRRPAERPAVNTSLGLPPPELPRLPGPRAPGRAPAAAPAEKAPANAATPAPSAE